MARMKPGIDSEVFIAKAGNWTNAIGQHLLNNEKCASHYDDNQFSILAKGRTLFHLSTLEATFIKILQSELCRQKEFVCTLKLRH